MPLLRREVVKRFADSDLGEEIEPNRMELTQRLRQLLLLYLGNVPTPAIITLPIAKYKSLVDDSLDDNDVYM